MLAAVAAILAGLCLSGTSANALCAPDPASSGQTVTCSGNDADGFQAGAGVNTLTVNVLPGAIVSDNGTAAISVNDSNTVTNGGTLTVGALLTGINAGSFNNLTNNAGITAGDNGIGISALDFNNLANNGTITVGNFAAAIAIGDNNKVTNSGTLAAGSSGTGIFAGVNNTVTNAATGIITIADNGNGIFVAGNSTVTNAGAIAIGATAGPAAGIFAINDDNTIVNSAGASISAGDVAVAIFVQGNRTTVSNAGTLTAADGGAGIVVYGDDAKVTSSASINVANDFGAGISLQGDRAVITNSGHIVVGNTSSGILVLGEANTIINRGTITAGNDFPSAGIDVSSLGSGTNHIVNTGTINVGTDGTGIVVNGNGTVFNSGTINAAAGFAAIEFCGCGAGNVLTLGPGSVINGLVLGAGTFQLGGTGSDTFNLGLIGPGQQYDGFSTFNKVDSSNWTVVGTGAQDWNVLGGTLSVNGTITGAVTVSAGGALAGIGTVGDTTIAGGGIFLPGNGTPGSSLTVGGNLALQSGALYMVQLNSVTSTFANVTGNAALAGTVGASFAPGSTVQKQYTIMTAGSLSGAFDGAGVVGGPGGLVATVSYDATHAFLNFALDFSAMPGLNVNQRNVGTALTNFFNANGGIPAAFATLGAAGLTQASGELGTGSQQATFNAMNQFLGLLTDPFVAGRGNGFGGNTGASPFADEADRAGAYAASGKPRSKSERDAYGMITKAVPRNDLLDPRWSVWAAGFGGSQTTDGNPVLGSNTVTSRLFGAAVGADYLFSPYTIAGFALAGGGTNFSLANGLGSGRSDLFQAGAFVRHTIGPAYFTGALAYGWQDVMTDRTVTIAGVDRLRAQFNADTFAGRFEAGYRYATPWMGITPYAAAQVTTFDLPNYAEAVVSGANTFAQSYAAKSVTDTRSELGLRTDKSFAVQGGLLTLRGRAAWAHDFNPDRSIGAAFQTLPGAAFVVNGAGQARDLALTTASVEMNWLNGWSAAATFEGEFSDVTRSYAGKGVVRYAW